MTDEELAPEHETEGTVSWWVPCCHVEPQWLHIHKGKDRVFFGHQEYRADQAQLLARTLLAAAAWARPSESVPS